MKKLEYTDEATFITEEVGKNMTTQVPTLDFNMNKK
jgi:hypothetical protein